MKMSSKAPRHAGLILIGLFKLAKGIGLLAVAIGLLHLLHRDVEATLTHWIEVFRVDPGNHYIHEALVKVFRVTPRQLKELSAGTFLYSAIFLVEGFGLLKKKHWAEYMTVISTSLFIPLECYELWRRVTWTRGAVLVINILTVWYLVNGLRKRKF